MSTPGEPGFRALDVSRMLLGEDVSLPLLLEMVLRTGAIFLWLLLLLRMTGKRGLSQLSPLELAIVIALGTAAGDPMLYTDVPLLLAMLILAVVVFMQRGVSSLMMRSHKFEHFVDGYPVELVRDGVVVPGSLHRARLSQEDLFERLRPEGVEQLGQVRRVYLEQSCALSVYLLPPEEVRSGLPVVPPWDLEAPPPVPADFTGLVACRQCGTVFMQGQPPACTCQDGRPIRATVDPWA